MDLTNLQHAESELFNLFINAVSNQGIIHSSYDLCSFYQSVLAN